MKRSRLVLALLAVLALVAAGCGDDSPEGATGGGATSTTAARGGEEPTGTLTIYSGRSEELVGPIIEQFEAETGIDVEVRYGDTAELAAQILEEGDNSPADVYFGQDAGALGALSSNGALASLPEELLEQVDPAVRSQAGEWVGISGRARVLVYNTDAVTEDELPASVLDLTDPAWKGRIGWAPTNGSFQAFVTGLRVLEGDDTARSWLEGVQANAPEVFEKNGAIVEAVAAGEIEVGLVNHYYALKAKAEDPGLAVANHYFTDGDPGGLLNVAGAGIVRGSDQQEAAEAFIAFLLSEQGQSYFAEETYEVPLAAGVEPAGETPDFASMTVPDIDLDQLEDLAGTLTMLEETGVL